MKPTDLEQFKDVRNTLSDILKDLAEVANEREEKITIDLEGSRESSTQSHSEKRFLGEVLRDKSILAAAESTFRLAVIGEFSRGKSTLINTLLKKEVLTSDPRPNTACLTVIRYGVPERFEVHYLDGTLRKKESSDLKKDLVNFTSDTNVVSRSKKSKKSVAETVREVKIWCDAEILKEREIEIIDTPGLGSVFPAHRLVTYKAIPSMDATLFLVQSDPGVGENDIVFLKYMYEFVDKFFFVMTKADYARSNAELKAQLNFFEETVFEKAQIEVENLFAISAYRALEGDMKNSGFHDFLRALEDFLVRSSGIARLHLPRDLAHTHGSRMKDAIERDIGALDQNLDDLRSELNRLLGEKKTIQSRRDELLEDIDAQIKDMMEIATDGIDDQPVLIQKSVDSKIDSLTIKELWKANEILQEEIKNSVIDWLKKKEDRFKSSAQRLQKRIESDLNKLLENLEMSETSADFSIKLALEMPDLKSGFGGHVVGIIGDALAVGIITFVISGIVAVFPLSALGVLVAEVMALGGVGIKLSYPKKKLQGRIKIRLGKPLPGNEINIYQAVVEGYVDKNAKKIQGIREIINDAFQNMGNQLKRSIFDIVETNLDSRLDQFERQVKEKEQGQSNKSQALEKYKLQMITLEDIRTRMDQVDEIISGWSSRPVQ